MGAVTRRFIVCSNTVRTTTQNNNSHTGQLKGRCRCSIRVPFYPFNTPFGMYLREKLLQNACCRSCRDPMVPRPHAEPVEVQPNQALPHTPPWLELED